MVAAHRQQIRAANETYQAEHAKNSDMSAQISEIESEATSLRQQVETLEEEKAALKSECAKWDAQVRGQQRRLETVHTEQLQMVDDLTKGMEGEESGKASDMEAKLAAQLKDSASKSATMQAEIESLGVQVAKANEKVESIRRAAKKQLDLKTEQLNQYQKLTQAAKEESRVAKATRFQVETRFESERKHLEEVTAESQAASVEANERAADLQSDVIRLEHELKNSEIDSAKRKDAQDRVRVALTDNIMDKNEATDTVESLQASRVEAQKLHIAMTSDLESSRARATEMMASSNAAAKRAADAEEQLTDSVMTIKTLRGKLDTCETALSEANEDLTATKADLEKTTTELEQTIAARDTAELSLRKVTLQHENAITLAATSTKQMEHHKGLHEELQRRLSATVIGNEAEIKVNNARVVQMAEESEVVEIPQIKEKAKLLTASKQSLTGDVAKLTAQLDSEKKRVDDLSKKFSAERNKAAQLASELNKLQHEHGSTAVTLGKVRQQAVEHRVGMMSKMGAAEGQPHSKTLEATKLSTALQGSREELSALKLSFEKVSSAEAEKTAAVNGLQRRASHLQEQLDDAGQEISGLKKTNLQLADRVSDLSAQGDTLRSKIQALEEEIAADESKLTEDQKTLAAHDKSAAVKLAAGQVDADRRVNVLQKQIDTTKDEKTKVMSELHGVQEELKKAEGQLKSTAAELVESNTALQEKAGQFERKSADLVDVSKSLDHAEQQVRDQDDAIKVLQDQLDTCEARIRDAEGKRNDELLDNRVALTKIENRLKEQEMALDAAKEAMAQKDSEVATLNALVTQRTASLASLHSQLTSLGSRITRGEAEIRGLRLARAALQMRLEAMRSGRAKAKTELESAQVGAMAMGADIATVQKQAMMQSSMIEELEGDVTASTDRVKKLGVELVEKSAVLVEQRAVATTVTKELGDLKATCEGLNRTVDSNTTTIANLGEEKRNDTQRISELLESAKVLQPSSRPCGQGRTTGTGCTLTSQSRLSTSSRRKTVPRPRRSGSRIRCMRRWLSKLLGSTRRLPARSSAHSPRRAHWASASCRTRTKTANTTRWSTRSTRARSVTSSRTWSPARCCSRSTARMWMDRWSTSLRRSQRPAGC